MTQRSRVSVIIPAYNRKHLIESAIESVLRQTYKNCELILVDDASIDGTNRWVAERYPTVKLIRLNENVGAAEARNVGIESSQGELIAFLDSDDYWEETYLEKMVQLLSNHPQASFAFSNHRESRPDGTIKEFTYQSSTAYVDLIHRLLIDTFIHTMSTVVVRENALQRSGLLNSRLCVSEDRELYIRLLKEGELAHTDETLVTRVMHSQNISSDYRRWAKHVFLILDIFFKDPKNKNYCSLEPGIRSMRARMFARYFWQIEKDPVMSALMIVRAFKATPLFMLRKVQEKLLQNVT